jgi:type II secretion system protein N
MTIGGSHLMTSLTVPREPRPSPEPSSRDWRARLTTRLADTRATELLLYGGYTLLAFVVFLLLTFPHELVVQRLLARAETGPVDVDVRGIHLGWTLAYTIDELRLLARGDDRAVPLLSAAHVRVAPSLISLFRGHPYPVAVSGDLYGGTLSGTVDLRPAAFAIDARLAGVDVGRYAGLRLFMEGTLRGRIDGELALQGNAEKPATTTGQISLRAGDLALEGGKIRGITVPDLHFPEVRLAGDVKRGRLELGDVVANGSEISARGDGNVVLQHPLAASIMNLTLAVRPAPQAPDNLKLALNLLPGTPGEGGERTLRLYGSFDKPRVQ